MQTDDPFEHSIYIVRAGPIQIARGDAIFLSASGSKILWAILLGFLGPRIWVYVGKSRRTQVLKVDRPRDFCLMSDIYDYPVLICQELANWDRAINESWLEVARP